jgi:hypothetical protein
MTESESTKGDKVNDVCANNDDSQFFNVASKVMKKLDSKPKSIEAKVTTSVAGASKAFKSPKAKLPLQILVSFAYRIYLTYFDLTSQLFRS